MCPLKLLAIEQHRESNRIEQNVWYSITITITITISKSNNYYVRERGQYYCCSSYYSPYSFPWISKQRFRKLIERSQGCLKLETAHVNSASLT